MARPRKVDTLSLNELQAMISERRSKLSSLKKERTKLLKKLGQLEKEIERAGGEISGGRRAGSSRPRNDRPLPDVIESVLGRGKEMKVPDIAHAVQEAGYKSSSPKFTSIVNQALIKDKKRFHAVARGVYALKK